MCGARDILRELKKGQELLGHLHDRQELIDNLPAADDPQRPAAAEPVQLDLVTQVVEAEADDLHGRYLARRERLLDAARAAQRAVTPVRRRVWPAAAALAASSTLLLWRGRRA